MEGLCPHYSFCMISIQILSTISDAQNKLWRPPLTEIGETAKIIMTTFAIRYISYFLYGII